MNSKCVEIATEEEKAVLIPRERDQDCVAGGGKRAIRLYAAGAALGSGLLMFIMAATILISLYGRPFYNASPHPWPYAFFQPADALEPNHTFFVVGDWGRQGNQNQMDVATLMGQVAELAQPSFVISTGDNFYQHGLSSYDDPLFKESFTDVYNASGLQVPWYAVLGNHDYPDFFASLFHPPKSGRYSEHWQDTSRHPDINLASRDPRWICKQGVWRQSFGTTLDIIFIDTMPQLVGSTLASYTKGGLGYKTSAIMTDTMEELLGSSRARFKIVVGHMPIRNFGGHCSYRETAHECARLSFIEPILVKHKVDAYFAGHDHNLQLIRTDQGSSASSSLLHVVSGAGSDTKSEAFDKIPRKLKETRNFWMSEAPGFVSVSLKANIMTVDFWDARSQRKLHSVQKIAS